jgi:hypothetical protein
MMSSARRRPGTSPSFRRSYHKAQLSIAARCTLKVPSGIVRQASIRDAIANYEKTQRPAAAKFCLCRPNVDVLNGKITCSNHLSDLPVIHPG